MSHVAHVIILCAAADGHDYRRFLRGEIGPDDTRLREINAFFATAAAGPNRGYGLMSLGKLEGHSELAVGGPHAFTVGMYLGAFTDLDLEAFLTHLRDNVPWERPEDVQVLVKGERDERFTLIAL